MNQRKHFFRIVEFFLFLILHDTKSFTFTNTKTITKTITRANLSQNTLCKHCIQPNINSYFPYISGGPNPTSSSSFRIGYLRLRSTYKNDNLVSDVSENKNIDQIDSKSTQSDEDQQEELITNRNLRFSGVGRLYTSPSEQSQNELSSTSPHIDIINRLTSSTVAIVGLGGVGSWAAEALCRSGVGHLILIDMDDICISNTNRQLHTLTSTIGKSKIHEMKERLLNINPQCNITTVFDFVSKDNVDSIIEKLTPNLTVCLDAIDGQNEKTALIAACVSKSIPIVTCGGAAGRSDPTKITCDDLTKVQDDRLLFKCRKQLRKFHGFPKGPKSGEKNNHRFQKWNILAVFSTELQKKVDFKNNDGVGAMRQCDGALGTACFVTGTYGFVAASRIVDMIASNELIFPIIPDKR